MRPPWNAVPSNCPRIPTALAVDNMDSRQQLQETLYHEIPITEAMGIEVDSYDGKTLTLSAPLAKNDNHKSTAFGGSLSTLAITTAWSLLQLKLQESNLEAEVVIQHAESRFLLPVHGRLCCSAKWDGEKWPRFEKGLRQHGRARMKIEADIKEGDDLALHFIGTYVAMKTEAE